MNESEAENLIERGLSAGRPREMFAAQLLADSTAALVQGRRRRSAWRRAELAGAAALIVGVAFLAGRLSAPPTPPAPVAPGAVAEDHNIRVPREVLAWLEAARLFKQLGMKDRMARAVERAGKLLPADTSVVDGQTLRAFAAQPTGNQEETVKLAGLSGAHRLAEGRSPILAQSFERLKNEN